MSTPSYSQSNLSSPSLEKFQDDQFIYKNEVYQDYHQEIENNQNSNQIYPQEGPLNNNNNIIKMESPFLYQQEPKISQTNSVSSDLRQNRQEQFYYQEPSNQQTDQWNNYSTYYQQQEYNDINQFDNQHQNEVINIQEEIKGQEEGEEERSENNHTGKQDSDQISHQDGLEEGEKEQEEQEDEQNENLQNNINPERSQNQIETNEDSKNQQRIESLIWKRQKTSESDSINNKDEDEESSDDKQAYLPKLFKNTIVNRLHLRRRLKSRLKQTALFEGKPTQLSAAEKRARRRLLNKQQKGYGQEIEMPQLTSFEIGLNEIERTCHEVITNKMRLILRNYFLNENTNRQINHLAKMAGFNYQHQSKLIVPGEIKHSLIQQSDFSQVQEVQKDNLLPLDLISTDDLNNQIVYNQIVKFEETKGIDKSSDDQKQKEDIGSLLLKRNEARKLKK